MPKRQSMPAEQSFDALKDRITSEKMPLPKTEEKFNNYINNRFQVSDNKVTVS